MTKTISVCRPHGDNYTPRSLMIQYAKEHEPSVQFDYGVVPCLIIHGRRWAYDHWEIETHTVGGKEYDRIDLHLHEIP